MRIILDQVHAEPEGTLLVTTLFVDEFLHAVINLSNQISGLVSKLWYYCPQQSLYIATSATCIGFIVASDKHTVYIDHIYMTTLISTYRPWPHINI